MRLPPLIPGINRSDFGSYGAVVDDGDGNIDMADLSMIPPEMLVVLEERGAIIDMIDSRGAVIDDATLIRMLSPSLPAQRLQVEVDGTAVDLSPDIIFAWQAVIVGFLCLVAISIFSFILVFIATLTT